MLSDASSAGTQVFSGQRYTGTEAQTQKSVAALTKRIDARSVLASPISHCFLKKNINYIYLNILASSLIDKN